MHSDKQIITGRLQSDFSPIKFDKNNTLKRSEILTQSPRHTINLKQVYPELRVSQDKVKKLLQTQILNHMLNNAKRTLDELSSSRVASRSKSSSILQARDSGTTVTCLDRLEQ